MAERKPWENTGSPSMEQRGAELREIGSSQDLDAHSRERHLQETGRELVNQLFMYIRALQLYSSDNDVFQRPLAIMVRLINRHIQHEGELRLFGDSSTMYLNSTLLRFPFSSLPSVNFLLEAWSSLGIGGFTLKQEVTPQELQEYLQQFSTGGGEQLNPYGFHNSAIESESLMRVRARIQSAIQSELQDIAKAKVDIQQYAVMLYGRLLQLVLRSRRTLSDESSLLLNQITRTLQELIDLSSTQRVNFLGFTNELDTEMYEGYHICNTIFFAVLFGHHLGMRRVELLDLSLAGIYHSKGKRWLPPKLLDNPRPLGSDEQRQIRKIGVYSVQELLMGSFSWDKVRRALIVAGCYASVDLSTDKPQAPFLVRKSPQGIEPNLQYDGPFLSSQILRMSSIFDSLCTRRPFRVKLFPAEALMKMRLHLGKYFDPYLLQRFIGFFSPMAMHKAADPLASLNPPHEDPAARAYGERLSPFGFGLRRARASYWSLRRLSNPTPEQQKKLKELRRWMDRRSDIQGHFSEVAQATSTTTSAGRTPSRAPAMAPRQEQSPRRQTQTQSSAFQQQSATGQTRPSTGSHGSFSPPVIRGEEVHERPTGSQPAFVRPAQQPGATGRRPGDPLPPRAPGHRSPGRPSQARPAASPTPLRDTPARPIHAVFDTQSNEPQARFYDDISVEIETTGQSQDDEHPMVDELNAFAFIDDEED